MKLLKSISRRCEEIEAYLFGGGRRKSSKALIIFASLDAFGWILYSQITGRIPVTSGINLIWCHVAPSLTVSRLWDMFLMPAWLIFMGYIGTSYMLMEKDDPYVSDDTVGPIGTILIVAALLASITGLVFGAVYTPLIFCLLMILTVLVLVAAIVCCLVFLIGNDFVEDMVTKFPRWKKKKV